MKNVIQFVAVGILYLIPEIIGQQFFFCVSDKKCLFPFHIGVFNKPKGLGGGQICPPGYMAIGGYFHYSFQTGM